MVRSSPAEALALAEQALERETGATRAEAAECKAAALGLLERWSEAQPAFLAAHDLLPADQAERRTTMLVGAAIAAEAQNRLDVAVDLFQTARGEARAAGNLTLAGAIARDMANPLDRLGRTDEALAALAEARAALPDDPLTWLISARASRKYQRLADAQGQIERAASLDPRDPLIGLEAGVIAMLSGREDAARKSWQSVLKAAPGSQAAKTAQGYLDQLGPETAQPRP
jgi:tetratricopeptide (TPR) repeat protein